MALGGCGVGDRSPYYTSPAGQGGAGATPAACAEGNLFDTECDPAPPCCVDGPTPPYEGPSWFAIGAPETVGPCPSSTTEGLTGYAGMKKPEPHTCGACSCSPAACSLPEGIHTNAAPCAGADGSLAVPLGPDPAAGWTGACSEEGALPADLLCDGAPCAQSVTVPAMPVAACQPSAGPATFPEPTWGRMARQCVPNPFSGEACPDEHQVCAPQPPQGFSLCLYVKADHPTCPEEYPRREVFYRDVEDKRGCTLCECSDPQGAQCMALFQAFSDAACASLAGAVIVTDQDDSCFDVDPGTALGSFEASVLVDIAGSCTATGGTPFGGVRPAEPLTLCCQGDPEAPG